MVYKGYYKHSNSKFMIYSDEARALPLARASLEAGSKYGQFVFGLLCECRTGGVAKDGIQAVAHVRMAAAQGLDAALLKLAEFYNHGTMYYFGTEDIAKDDQEFLRLLLLSASQGYLPALFSAGRHYEWVARNFYEKAADGGARQAKNQVRMFDSMHCGPPLDFEDDDDDDDDDGVDWTDGDGDDDDDDSEDDA
jgi:TPR repeat protein